MKNVTKAILLFTIFISCSNKKQIDKTLADNNISEFKYLLEFIEKKDLQDSCVSPKEFNNLYKYMRIVPIDSSSWVFLNGDFLLLFDMDSIMIFRPPEIRCENPFVDDLTHGYLQYDKAISYEIDSFKLSFDLYYHDLYSYYFKKHASNRIKDYYQFELSSLWINDDRKYTLYYEYDCRWNLVECYKYDKTIKNIYTRNSTIMCVKNSLLYPFESGAYGSEEQAQRYLDAYFKRIW